MVEPAQVLLVLGLVLRSLVQVLVEVGLEEEVPAVEVLQVAMLAVKQWGLAVAMLVVVLDSRQVNFVVAVVEGIEVVVFVVGEIEVVV